MSNSGLDFSDQEIQEFRTESTDLLDDAENHLLALDRGAEFSAHYDAIFRAFHSIKGAAGMLGWARLQEHMHRLESQFQDLKGAQGLNKGQASYFLRGVDVCRKLLNGAEVDFDYEIDSSPMADLDTKAPIEESHSADPTQAPKGRIVVIDDEEDLLELLKEMLIDAGHEVRAFTDPTRAVESIREDVPDLVLTDFRMPALSGLDVLRLVHEIECEVPVVFISGHLTKEMVIEAISGGIFGVIEKPFQEARVLSVCAAGVRQRRLTMLLGQSLSLVMFQFSDLERFLDQTGRSAAKDRMREELTTILKARRELRLSRTPVVKK